MEEDRLSKRLLRTVRLAPAMQNFPHSGDPSRESTPAARRGRKATGQALPDGWVAEGRRQALASMWSPRGETHARARMLPPVVCRVRTISLHVAIDVAHDPGGHPCGTRSCFRW